jgi:NADPH-dependent 2,4-dienoyl-CoA reductase/sulfur reductase-like enzyme
VIGCGPKARHTRRDFLHAAALAAVGSALPLRAASVRARVVIAGGGFAGAGCAMALRALDPSIEVTLIDPDDSYVTGPMSNAALVGWRSIDSITVSRAGLARAGVRVVRDRVLAIDASARKVGLAAGAELRYDRLVVAPGIRLLWDKPQGYDEAASLRMPHAWIPGRQTELLAAQLRAMDDGGVVAISVPSGLMRCPPGPYERASVIAAWLKQYKPRSKVLILDCNNHFPRQQIFEDAWKKHYPGMVEWIASTDGGAVERIDVDKYILYTSRGAQRVAVANIIPPQAPAQLAIDAGLASGHGWCPVVADTFESTLAKNVHVIGDACIAGTMPKSASAAHSQARRCAAAIVALLAGNAAGTAELDSVCYSLLAQREALSIHGRFGIENGEIRSLPLPSPTRAPSPHEEAQLGERWYRQIVAESFGN